MEESNVPKKTTPLGPRLSHSMSEQNLNTKSLEDPRKQSTAYLYPPQQSSVGQLRTSPSNQTLGSGVSAYYSPAGSKISNSRPAGSCIYDSRQDLAAYSTAIPSTCLHKQDGL